MILEWDDAEALVLDRECHREGVGERSARSVLPSRMVSISCPVVPIYLYVCMYSTEYC